MHTHTDSGAAVGPLLDKLTVNQRQTIASQPKLKMKGEATLRKLTPYLCP